MTESEIIDCLRSVLDPEIGVNVVDLGLVYCVDFSDGTLHVDLGVTSPACPMGPQLIREAETALRSRFPEAEEVKVVLTRTPPWSPERMSAAAKEQLGVK